MQRKIHYLYGSTEHKDIVNYPAEAPCRRSKIGRIMGYLTTRYLNAPLYCQICKITEPHVVFVSVDGSSILATFL